jgi:hypothetical protein
MPLARLTSLNGNKRILLSTTPFSSIKAYRTAQAAKGTIIMSDDQAYMILMDKFNATIDEQNAIEQAKINKKAYEAEKRKNFAERFKNVAKLLNKRGQGTSIAAKDLALYNDTKSGVFAQEVVVHYDCQTKEDNGWSRPFRTSRRAVVVSNSPFALKAKVQAKAQDIQDELQSISPEQNSNFEFKFGRVYKSADKVPITKILMKNSMPFKLNDEALPEWDLGEGRCVYDHIIHLWSLPDSKMIKKANVAYLNSQFTTDENPDPYLNGVSIDQLYDLAKKEQFTMYAFDTENNLVKKYVTDVTTKRPMLMFRLHNQHMYLIDDEFTRKSLVAKNRETDSIRNSNIVADGKKHMIQDKKEYNIVVNDNSDIRPNDFACKYIFENGAIPFPFTAKNIEYSAGSINRMIIGDTKIFTKPIEKNIVSYLEHTGEKYNGQHRINLMMSMYKECYGYDFKDNELLSEMNPMACNVFAQANVKNRVQLGTVNFEPLWGNHECGTFTRDGEKIIGADVNKCYSSILDNPAEDWLVYALTDEIEEYNQTDEINTGLFYALTDDITIMHQSNWYSAAMINYAKQNGVTMNITHKYVPRIQKSNRDYFKYIVDYIIDKKCSPSLTKDILNSLTGMLGKTHASTYKMSITTDLNEIWDCLESNGETNFILEELVHQGKVLYIYGYKRTATVVTNNLPMYIQMLDQSNIILHKLQVKLGGRLVYRKTDAVLVIGGEPVKSYDKNKRENWGKQVMMTADEVRKCNFEQEANRDRHAHLPSDRVGWHMFREITTSSQYKQIIELAIENRGLFVCARAGTGKSYIINKGVEDGLLSDEPKTRLAFTNKAARNIQGSTIHKAISIDADTSTASQKMINKYKFIQHNGQTVIIVDEYSMISSKLWSYLISLKRLTGAIFIIFGDYRQLPAVERDDCDYTETSILKYLTNNNRCELTVRQRYDAELWDFLEVYYETGVIGDALKHVTEPNYNAYNICYLNKTRIRVNDLYMKHFKPKDAMFLPIKPCNTCGQKDDDKAADVWIYKGLPVMAIVNKTRADKKDEVAVLYCNSDTMTVTAYDENTITMTLDCADENGNDTIKVLTSEFHKSFVCNYCSTTHKNQGVTISDDIQLWDWERMLRDRRIAYTAISRAKTIQQVTIVTL